GDVCKSPSARPLDQFPAGTTVLASAAPSSCTSLQRWVEAKNAAQDFEASVASAGWLALHSVKSWCSVPHKLRKQPFMSFAGTPARLGGCCALATRRMVFERWLRQPSRNENSPPEIG